MALPAIPGSVLAEMQVVAKKAYRHAERLLEREWRVRFGRRWVYSDGYAGSDEDYGEAYAFASWAAEEALRRRGFPDIEEKYAYLFWDGERIEFDEY